MPQLTGLRSEWIHYEMQVINRRQVVHPELRAEACEAFIGGAAAMFRIFTEQIANLPYAEAQRAAINELQEEIRVFAFQAGRK